MAGFSLLKETLPAHWREVCPSRTKHQIAIHILNLSAKQQGLLVLSLCLMIEQFKRLFQYAVLQLRLRLARVLGGHKSRGVDLAVGQGHPL